MIRFRSYRALDQPALRRLHARQVRRSGATFAFPNLDDPRYLRTFVAERDGEIVGAIVTHATLETFFVGDDPGLLRAAIRAKPALERALASAGADELHAFVPRRWRRAMAPLLKRLGFRPSNEAFVTFYREL